MTPIPSRERLPVRPGIVFMGTPGFAVPTLRSLVEQGHRVLSVVTQPDKPKGRGKKLGLSPVKEFALAHLESRYGPSSGCWTYEDAHDMPVGLIVRWDTPQGKEIRPISRLPCTPSVSSIPASRTPRLMASTAVSMVP